MYMNLKPNRHKRISFDTTTMTSSVFISPPPHRPIKFSSPPNLIFCSGPPPNCFGLKFSGGCYHASIQELYIHIQAYWEHCVMLANAETWYIWNPEIFRTLL